MIEFPFEGLSGQVTREEIWTRAELSPAGFSYLHKSLLCACSSYPKGLHPSENKKISLAQMATSRIAWSVGRHECKNAINGQNCHLNFFFGAFTDIQGDTGQSTAPGHTLSSREGLISPLLNDNLSCVPIKCVAGGQMTSSVDHCSCEYNYGDFSDSFISNGMDSLGIAFLDLSHIISIESKGSIRVSEPNVTLFCSIAKRIVLQMPEIRNEKLNQNAPKNFYFNSFVTSQAKASGAKR
jgi:hypothetical protein